MALLINEDCINCGACEPTCPNNAIYEGGAQWRYADKTSLEGSSTAPWGDAIDATAEHEALSNEFYYIVPEKCTECNGFHEEPQCISECPVDCIITHPDHVESVEQLLAKKQFLHLN